MNPVICPYCSNPAELTTGDSIYPARPDLACRKFYACAPCNAYVGCHKDGKPLGRLANAGLRAAKQATHAQFDPIWKSGKKSRSEAYQWLAQQLNITQAECHIGMFDLTTCKKATLLIQKAKAQDLKKSSKV